MVQPWRTVTWRLTRCRTVFTTSRLVTCPTSISPIRTANFRLSFVVILTTSSGLLISLKGGDFKSAMVYFVTIHWYTILKSTHDHKIQENIISSAHMITHQSRILPFWIWGCCQGLFSTLYPYNSTKLPIIFEMVEYSIKKFKCVVKLAIQKTEINFWRNR